ncbi:beta-mannosidase [Hyperolius riggenbachi]|uniref:beta-mannosidase n=1 Tax=Hyperolius riggenbachi TaxID=752182 RepID=UPI0035A34844
MATGGGSDLSFGKWWMVCGLLQIASGAWWEAEAEHAVQVYSLNGKWTIRNSNNSVMLYGEVPGCVHTALYSGGHIKDAYFRFNDIVYKWIGHDSWIYSKEFSLPPDIRFGQKIVLVCEGIDTVSTITLNNITIGKTQNMFSRYVIDITKIVSQKNYVEIKFQSAVEWAKEKSNNHSYAVPPNCPPKVQKGECHVNFIRKNQCSFSWDWGPSFPTQGIWRDIRIEAYNLINMDRISYMTVFDNRTSQWTIIIEPVFDVIAGEPLKGHMTVRISDLHLDASYHLVVFPGQLAYKIIVKISKNTSLNLWWPNGYGLQSSYNMSINFTFGSEHVIQRTAKIYFRTVELIEEPIVGSPGLSFYVKINGVPIFLKGSNWIPADSFQDRVGFTKFRNLLQSAVDANMNTLRVWGGGVYESDDFYDLCDELGIMVWHDFMFACSLYPTDEWFLDTVKTEVTHQIRRLKSHPCIIVWSGNNENEAAFANDWFSIPSYMREVYVQDYLTLYIKTIRELVLVLDGTRPFIASSPTNGKETVRENWLSKDPYDNHYGDTHYYNYSADCWDWQLYPRPRFASEYGFQSWPSFSTIAQISSLEDWSYNSNFTDHRQHHAEGNEEMVAQAALHYNMPVNTDPLKEFQDTLYLTQVMQAQCVKLQTEFYRRSRGEIVNGLGFTMGALYWQLNDIWQAPSWSSIEYGGKWKMLHYYAKDFFAPVATSAYEDKDILYIFGVSDFIKDCAFRISVKVYKWDSVVPVCENISEEFVIKSRSSAEIYQEPVSELLRRCNTTRRNSVLVYQLLQGGQPYGAKNWHFLTSPKAAKGLLKFNFTVSVSQMDQETYVITLEGPSPAAFVWLDVGNIAGRFSDNGFLLTEKKTAVYFHAWNPTTVDELKSTLHITTLRDLY